MGKMLARMGFPDKAARCVVAVQGVLNGRRDIGPDCFIPHKWMARQLGSKWKPENSDVFVGRYLDAIKEAEYGAGRRCFKIGRASETQLMTSYEANYIGEAALWALCEAEKSESYGANPSAAVTDELIDEAIALLNEAARPARDESAGPSITDSAVIKGLWSKSDTWAEAAMRKIAEAGGDPLAELQEVQQRQRRIAVEIQHERLERERREREAERAADPPEMWKASGSTLSDKTPAPEDAVGGAAPRQFVGGAVGSLGGRRS